MAATRGIDEVVEADIQTPQQEGCPGTWSDHLPGTGRAGRYLNYTGLLMNGCGRFTGTTIRTSPRDRAVEGEKLDNLERHRDFDDFIFVSDDFGLCVPGNIDSLQNHIITSRSCAAFGFGAGGFCHVLGSSYGVYIHIGATTHG